MTISAREAGLIKGMIARGDRQHDIAAHFGQNGGRIADVGLGRLHRDVPPAPPSKLPPPRPPQVGIDPDAPLADQVKALQMMIATRCARDPSVVIIFIPALAKWIMDNLNTNNRKRRLSKIRIFAEYMLRVAFQLSGDTVKFSDEGVLIDGQNRLSACIRANRPFETHTVFGISPEAFPVIDNNTPRTNEDTMQIEGAPHAALTARAVRWLMIFENNPEDRGRTFENAELLKFYQQKVNHAVLERSIAIALKVGRAIPQGNLVALLYLFFAEYPRATDHFAADLVSMKRGGLCLMRKLDKLRAQTLNRLHENQVNALIIQAWQSYRDGKRLKEAMLNWNETKEFPSIG